MSRYAVTGNRDRNVTGRILAGWNSPICEIYRQHSGFVSDHDKDVQDIVRLGHLSVHTVLVPEGERRLFGQKVNRYVGRVMATTNVQPSLVWCRPRAWRSRFRPDPKSSCDPRPSPSLSYAISNCLF